MSSQWIFSLRLNPVSSLCFTQVDLRWHTGVSSTLPLTETPVTADAAGSRQLAGPRAGVHGDGLADDEAVGDELADGLARVGVGDLVDLVGVEPDLALAAAGHGGRQALLRREVHPAREGLHVNIYGLFCGCAWWWRSR